LPGFLPLIRSGNLSAVDRISVSAAQSGRNENPQIAYECLVFDIPAIGLSQFLGRRHVYCGKLGSAGDTGTNTEHIVKASRRDHIGLTGKTRPRPNETHVSPQHVKELGQFIKLR
jgi:hypothetical protein